MPLHTGKGRTVGKAISAIIDYVKNPDKTDEQRLITSYECDSRMADAEFLFSKQQYVRNTGRDRGKDNVIAYHLRQAFVPGEITPEEANRLGRELAHRFTKGNHAYIVCTHIDKHHVHNHVIFNSVTLDCDRKFRNFWGSSKAIRRLNDTICIENGYSIVTDPQPHGKSYNKWLGDAKKPSHRELLRMAIDQALEQKPATFEAMLNLLSDAGYEIKRGKNPAFRCKGQKRFVRLDTLGDEYSMETLGSVISGVRKHTPREKRISAEAPQQLNLVVDIQRRIAEGKGAGYQRWASVFNLKQLAQSVNYLRDHNLLEYDQLVSRTESATAQYHELSAKIKEMERRMGDIAALRRHIINYMKTRDVYVAYRKAGYSKKFLAEHESEILLHKAAKQAFDELKIEKLPTIRNLQNEYAQLEAEKRKLYSAYRQAKDDMRDLLTAKENVDRMLGYDSPGQDKEKEQGQR